MHDDVQQLMGQSGHTRLVHASSGLHCMLVGQNACPVSMMPVIHCLQMATISPIFTFTYVTSSIFKPKSVPLSLCVTDSV